MKTLRFVMTLLLLILASAAVASFNVETGDKDFITVMDGKAPVLKWVRGEILAEGFPEDRRRSTYIHPLYSLDGIPLTDDFPKDHPHHRGVSWIWLTVRYDGKTSDLWTLRGIRQHYLSHKTCVSGDSMTLSVNSNWTDDAKTEVMNETVDVNIRKAQPEYRVLDFKITLKALRPQVAIGVSHSGYSGFNIRFAPRKGAEIWSSKGKITKDENRTRFEWTDYSGAFGSGKDIDGVTIIDSKENPHFPTGWTLRFYGVLNPAFTSNSEDYVIEQGKPLVLKYRVIVHKGRCNEELTHKLASEYNRNDW